MRYIFCLYFLALSSFVAFGSVLCDTSDIFPEMISHKKLLSSTKVINITPNGMNKNLRDSLENIMAKFYQNQFRHFQDPKAPGLMFMSSDANFAMGISGVIRMRGWYDWDGAMPGSGFCPYLISVADNPAHNRHLDATPAGTALVFTLFGRSQKFGNYMGYIEAGFSGYGNRDFKLKKAYVSAGDWTLGYATSTFCDPSTLPPAIDGAGANGSMSRTNVLIRYFHTWQSQWSVGAGIEIPSSQPEVSGSDVEGCDDWIPDLAALVQYQWDGGLSHIRLSGLVRGLSYRDKLSGTNETVVGWGAQLSSKIKVFSPLNLFGQLNAGHGYASYLNDLSIGNYDLIPDNSRAGHMYAPQSFGYTFGGQYFFRPNLYLCFTVGQLRIYKDHGHNPNDYRYGQYYAVTGFWDITPRFQVGAEYLLGKRKDYNGMQGDAQRINLMMQLAF